MTDCTICEEHIKSQLMKAVIKDYNSIQKGDMPGDKININETHVNKARVIFPELFKLYEAIIKKQQSKRIVISVYGGSGVGKSEIGSLLAYYFNNMGIGSYILSGDNYPHRMPKINDGERIRVFRENGIKGLVSKGEYTREKHIRLQELQGQDIDSNSGLIKEHPWLMVYQEAGQSSLSNYLGTSSEIDFNEVNSIIEQFKKGEEFIMLKRMGREEKELWYDAVDFRNISMLFIEWTHGNNDNLIGVDIPILLNSTPQETLEHRSARNRDGATDSPFTKLVLNIEQTLLFSQAHKAKIIVTKSGELISFEDYMKLMTVD